MTEYNGATSLQTALEQLHGKKLSFSGMAKITNKYRERLNLPTGKAINTTVDKLKIYQWERDAITQSSLIQSPPPIVEPVIELNITQLVNNDVAPIVEPVIELNITHAQNDSKQCDKFISINYRHADNSRHTVQLEQFYIDALTAIGITDTSKFVADNAGLAQVTRNVKRSIVNELVNRVTQSSLEPVNELNITQLVNDDVAPIVEPVANELKSDGRCTIWGGKSFAYRCKRNEYKEGRCKQHYNMFIKHG